MKNSLHGSCLCGAAKFEVRGPIRGVGSCHCSQCRKVSGTGGNTQFIVKNEKFKWLTDIASARKYENSNGWGVLRCEGCGSPLPESIDGKRTWVQAGLMDDPIDTDIKSHIFWASRAEWDVEAPDAKHFDEYPSQS